MFKYAWTEKPVIQLRENSLLEEAGVFPVPENRKNWKAIHVRGGWYKKIEIPPTDPTPSSAIPSAELPLPTPPSVQVIHQPDPSPTAPLQNSRLSTFIPKKIITPDIRLQLSPRPNNGLMFGSSAISHRNRPQKRWR